MALGAPEGAKVTVIEYASVTCAHCAEWQRTTWADFKAKYVDTGKVRYVFREIPTNPVPVAAAGFMLARCAGPEKYFDVVHTIMASQNEIFSGQPFRGTLLRIAQEQGGLTKAQFETCLKDKAGAEALDMRVKAGQDAGVTGTPTFLVNGEKVIEPNLTNLSTAIDAALAK